MAIATSAKIFPVHLYDGRREITAGNIKIHSDLHFKQFQFSLSQLLVNCYFLVVLKRSRRDRRKKVPENLSPAGYGYEDEQLRDYMNMIYSSSLNVNFPAIKDVYGRNDNRLKCEECLVAVKENKVPEFHCCVNDEVFFGFFRSPYGPISRKKTVRF
nr:hypothetical protein [Tanacetum cinerariifolium]